MGGLVARYFCKMLGGESKVFALFLLGCPNLGSIEAYSQLKNGLNVPYVRELFNSEQDVDDDQVDNPQASSAASQVAGAAVAIASGAGAMSMLAGSSQNDLTKIYVPLCVGAGRLLTRKEIVYFVRQMPSLYQMLPTANFCRFNKNWLVFDPLNTGQPASGFVVIFPTLLDVALVTARGVSGGLNAAAQRTGRDLRSTIDTSTLDATQSEVRNEALLSANSLNLVDMVAGLAAGASGTPEAEGRTGAIVQALVQHLKSAFFDCRNNRCVYDDIYTGLLDVPELRAISCANLQIAYAFDDALTLSPRQTKPESPMALLMTLLGPLLRHLQTQEGQIQGVEEDQADIQNQVNSTYIHPKTVVYWSADQPVDGGSFLLCERVISRYDSNLVKWQIELNPIGQAGTPPSGTDSGTLSTGVIAFGDGSVPFFSAKPPNFLTNTNVDSLSHGFPGVAHADMAKTQAVIDKLKNQIGGLLQDWLKP
jgi:hypothetical protein